MIMLLEKLDKDKFKDQFDVHNVVFNCYIRDGGLGKISTPSDEELLCLERVILIVTTIVLFIDWLVIFAVATNRKILIQVIHQNVVLLIGIIAIMMNVLKTGRHFIWTKIRESQKTIRYSLCQSNIREMYENLYACEWKIDGS